jgi:putative nucleotidyltransferase with HDIG domain
MDLQPERLAPLWKRTGIGLALLFALAIFLHVREVRVDVPELDTVSDRYFIGQVGFTFPDEEATIVLRQEAAREIGPIYQVDEKQLQHRKLEFERFMAQRQAKTPSLAEGADAVEEALSSCRFAEERTIRRARILNMTEECFYPLSSQDLDSVTLPKALFQRALEALSLSREEERLLLDFFRGQEWRLQEDSASERRLRQKAKDSVGVVYTRVDAGSQIIAVGERVTPRHLTMLKAMKQAIEEERNVWEPLPILGSVLLSALIMALSVCYLRAYHPDLFASLQRLSLLVIIVLLTLLLAKLTEWALLRQESSMIDVVRYPLFIPFAALLVCVLIGSEVALFASALLTVILGTSLAVDPARFMMVNLVSGLVMIAFSQAMHKRKEVFTVSGKAWAATVPVLIAFSLYQNNFWTLTLGTDIISTLAFLVATAILASGVLPVLESLFHVMTDMSLMEYADPSNPLLRRLSTEAPGTYQHCLVVGNLAENAARAIQANSLFCRVATLYHDIGKLYNPHYFTENQLGGFNIHQLLTPLESAQVIMAHVAEGESLARKNRLPASFVDIIREHHGTTLVYYFYCRQVELCEGDESKVNIKLFRYGGPKPRSKESAIIMIADTVEAASRSLEEVNEAALTEMVERLTAEKMTEGQFEDCRLTFEELKAVKQSIVKTLAVARHLRVKYPAKT